MLQILLCLNPCLFSLLFYFQATKLVLEKEAPGLALAMLMGSLKITHYAMLSRYDNKHICDSLQQKVP